MTSKQFYIMLFITTISLKVQKLPSIIYDTLGKDGYLILLAYFVVDMVLIAAAFFVLKTLKNRPIMPQNQNMFIMLFSKVLVLAIVVYFLIQGLLLYESIQNLFEHILFDNHRRNQKKRQPLQIAFGCPALYVSIVFTIWNLIHIYNFSGK